MRVGPGMIALVVAVPALAWGHGEHGTAQRLHSTGIITVQGYQVELLSDPAPLAVGRESRVIARVTGLDGQTPVSGGAVAIGLAPDGVPPAMVPAVEMTWAGQYGAAFTPARPGEHRILVALAALDGRRFAPPLAVAVPVVIGAAPGPGWGTAAALALVVGLAGVALYAARLRTEPGRPTGQPLDLLSLGWLRRLWTWRALGPALQVPLLGLAGLVVYLGFTDVQDGGRNLATKLTWTIWWAGIIFTFVLAGRAWCLACPFGALNEWTARWSGAWRRLPRPFRNLWWATGLFVLLTWADEQLGVVRSPWVTAWIVLGVAAVAVLVGLRYERRSFCRYLCPIGGVIGLYAMTAPVALRARQASVCRTDADKACYRGDASGRGCPMFEFPATMDRNTYCTLCGECVRACGHRNLTLHFRAPGQDLWATGRRSLDEAYLAAVLAGLTLLVTAEMLTAWPDWMVALARWLPPAVRATLKPVTYLTLVETGVLLLGALVVVPLLVLAAALAAERLAGTAATGRRRAFVTFAYMLVPVALSMHLAHNLAHLIEEGPGIVAVVQRTVALLTPLSLGEPDWAPAPLAGPEVLALAQGGVVVAFFGLSLVVGHRLSLRLYGHQRAAANAIVPFAVLALGLAAAGILLLSQPMGMRHAM